MKKGCLLLLVICLFGLPFYFAGCRQKVKTADSPVVLDSIHLSETYYLLNDTGKPSCNLQIHFVFPKTDIGNPLLSQMQRVFIEKFLGENFTSLSPTEAVESYKNQYINEFKQIEFESKSDSLDSFEDEAGMEDETGYAYYARLKNVIVFNQDNLISFTVEYRNYEGGAHGSYSIHGYVLDINTGKTIREDQLFGENYANNLAVLIVNKIAESNGLKDLKELENVGYGSIEEIAPNGNFTIDDRGITYYYNENEIAAYVMGSTRVFIPYKEINIYMKKDHPLSAIAGL